MHNYTYSAKYHFRFIPNGYKPVDIYIPDYATLECYLDVVFNLVKSYQSEKKTTTENDLALIKDIIELFTDQEFEIIFEP